MTEKDEPDSFDFDAKQISFASFKLLIENNAMLRLLLHNQDWIMKRLFIKQEFPCDVYNDLSEFFTTERESVRSSNHIERLTDLIRERIWEWVNLKVHFETDKPKDK